MLPIVCGIDVSKASITVCLLSSLPKDLRREAQTTKKLSFKADAEGIKAFLALNFDIAILEPTGTYSRIWRNILSANGREYRLVGHWEIASHRESLKLFSKTDKNDALCIAHYGLMHWGNDAAFLSDRTNDLTDYLRLYGHLTKTRTRLVNNLKSKLAYQVPELAYKDMRKRWGTVSPGVLLALVGEDARAKWELILSSTAGTGLNEVAKSLARSVVAIDAELLILERLIETEVSNFPEYVQALESVGLEGVYTQAHLISAFHPFDQFLKDGAVHWERRYTQADRRVRKNVSLSSFKLACGLGLVWVQSGDYSGWKPGGRADVRRSLYMASFADSKNLKLGEWEKGTGRQGLMKKSRKILEALFWELVKTSSANQTVERS